MPAPVQSRPRVNAEIVNFEVQVIDHGGGDLGVVRTAESIRTAAEAGFDLVEIAPQSQPVVCKFFPRRG